MSQLLEELATAQFIALHETVNPLMADGMTNDFTHACYLLRTPFLFQPKLNKRDGLFWYAVFPCLTSSLDCLGMVDFGQIMVIPNPVAPHFSTDSAVIHLQPFPNLPVAETLA